MDGRIANAKTKGADAHDGQAVLQSAKIIAQSSDLGNNSEFSRIGSLISPSHGQFPRGS
jgi:hypothetical protein